jgi:predicted alpha/beta hydrolase family esterase
MNASVLIVPGLRDQVANHWQTLLASRMPRAETVTPIGRENIDLDGRVAAIKAAAQRIGGPLIIVAHSAGCIMTAHWAKRTHCHQVIGALLAAPPDLETAMPQGYPTLEALRANGWLPVPREPLPFPSIVAASENDPLGRLDRVLELGRAWGGRIVNIGAVGHLNPASGFGYWPQAEDFIAELSTPVASAGLKRSAGR